MSGMNNQFTDPGMVKKCRANSVVSVHVDITKELSLKHINYHKEYKLSIILNQLDKW